jgi:hypothetical protein
MLSTGSSSNVEGPVRFLCTLNGRELALATWEADDDAAGALLEDEKATGGNGAGLGFKFWSFTYFNTSPLVNLPLGPVPSLVRFAS